MVKVEGKMESEVGIFSGFEVEVPSGLEVPEPPNTMFTTLTVRVMLLGMYWSSPAKDAAIVTEPTAFGAV
jgi:hypothetical protein